MSGSRGFSKQTTLKAFTIFGLILITAILLKLIAMMEPESHFSGWIEHISTALMVAAVLGISYEHLLYQERLDTLRGLLEESRDSAAVARVGTLPADKPCLPWSSPVVGDLPGM